MAPEEKDDTLRVAEMFGDVARALAAHQSLEAKLGQIVELAVANLEPCEYAGISLVQGRDITSSPSTGDVPSIVDAIQSEVDEGPCLDAIKEHEVFQTGDLAADERWPRFSSRANEETGIRSILSIRLFVDEDTMGALNLYSSQPDAFDDTDVAFATVFAAHAAVALSSSRREEHLERKAETRDLIGRAKGIISARSHVDDDQAFDMLRRASQRQNIKLVTVAERVVHPSDADPELEPSG